MHTLLYSKHLADEKMIGKYNQKEVNLTDNPSGDIRLKVYLSKAL